mmetsp:Transcript_29164/g.43354  ORF Transcript_29164/g.43354 Transcript_29164/m.43354 type:complete len:329 (-) Transcript_29164:128-1114(-)
MSIRNVHREITEQMSQTSSKAESGEGEDYTFLLNVKLNDVKKVWKKATFRSDAKQSNNSNSNAIGTQSSSSGGAAAAAAAFPSLPISGGSDGGPIKLYTVGDGSIHTLAQNYAFRDAAKEVTKARIEDNNNDEASSSATATVVETAEDIKNNYVHIFLDVPADRSGSKPHQALINFNDQKNATTASTTGAINRAARRSQKRSAKKGGKKATTTAAPPPPAQTDELGRMVVKIQVAAALEGMEHIKTPMLLYNSDKSARTFIHPPSGDDDDDGGYDRIKTLIQNQGSGGALGKTGGTKGYFYSKITKRVEGNDIISVDVASGLAPMQVW